jgi:hypothetical protein
VKSGLLISAVIMAAFALEAPARATIIDTTATQNGDINAFGSGPVGTATYGETFTATGMHLDSFSLFLENRFGCCSVAPLDLRGYIATWNGHRATSILYESATATMNAAGRLQEFNFAPNLNLTSGQQYVAFLSISNLPTQSPSLFEMPLTNGNTYAGGGFVFFNNGTNFSRLTTYNLDAPNWDTRFSNSDVWFTASFNNANPVPGPIAGEGIPGTLLAFGALIAWVRRMCRKLWRRVLPCYP